MSKVTAFSPIWSFLQSWRVPPPLPDGTCTFKVFCDSPSHPLFLLLPPPLHLALSLFTLSHCPHSQIQTQWLVGISFYSALLRCWIPFWLFFLFESCLCLVFAALLSVWLWVTFAFPFHTHSYLWYLQVSILALSPLPSPHLPPKTFICWTAPSKMSFPGQTSPVPMVKSTRFSHSMHVCSCPLLALVALKVENVQI